MDRLERLVLALVLLVLIFAAPAKAADVAVWSTNSDFYVTVEAGPSEIPVPMPTDMVITVAIGHRSFGIMDPDGTETRVHLSAEMLNNEKGAVGLGEMGAFNQGLKGLKAFLVEAKRKGLSLGGIGFELDPSVKKPFFRMSPDDGDNFGHHLFVGNFADKKQRELALSALGSK